MSRRIIRTVDGQVFSDSPGRFQDCKGEILYKRGFFNTVRINKRSITSDDITGNFAVLAVMVGLAIVFALLLLLAISMTSGRLLSDDSTRVPDAAKVVASKVIKTTAEENSEVVVDVKAGTYHLLNCPQLEKIEQHHKRIYFQQQAQSFGHKKHDACSR